MRLPISSRIVALCAAMLLIPIPTAAAATTQAILPGSVDPAAIDFGVIDVMTTSAPRATTYQNVNAFPVSILGVQVVPTDSTWPVTAQNCVGASIPAGGTCTVYLSFMAPAGEGTFAATMTILDGSPSGASVALTGQAVQPPGGVAWQPARSIRGSGTNPGNGLGRTVSSTSEYLHAAFTGDTVGGVPVAERGPYRLVSYVRSSTDGASWSSPIRLNPSTQHATAPVVAGGGSVVYVAWVKLSHVGVDSTGPRVLYVRVNRNHGIGTWAAAQRLSSLSGRVMSPRAAATAAYGFVAYTDAVTGAVRVARTRDRGQTWTTVTLGSTTRGTSGRKDAGVGVAAIGRLVVVSWISSATGIVKARSSIDGGATWGATGTIASGADPGTATSAAAMTGWVAVAFIDGSAVRFAYRMSYGGSWTGTGTVKAGPAYLGIESVAIGYIDHYTLGAAMVACRVSCSRVSPSYAADIVWREQEDGGTYWHGANILASTGPDTTAVGSPSVVVASSTLRFVTAAMRATSTGRDRLVIRAGYGRP